MSEERRVWFPSWHPLNDTKATIAWAVGWLAFFFGGILLSTWAAWRGLSLMAAVGVIGSLVGAVVILVASMAHFTLRGWRGFELHDDGVTLVGWHGRRRHVVWERWRETADGGDSLTFDADGETIRIDLMTAGYRQLQRAIESRLWPQAEPDENLGDLAPDEVARCLGIAVDGVLECRMPLNFPALFAVMVVTDGVTVLLSRHFRQAGERSLVPSGVLLAGLFLSVLVAKRCAPVAIRADVNGLVAGRRRRVPWSAVRRMSVGGKNGPLVVLRTDGEPIRFSRQAAGGAALEKGIRALLAARDAGHALPSDQPLSDAALSQARLSGEGDTERGLSRVEGGGEAP